jgi:excisionase family DNA binding protein
MIRARRGARTVTVANEQHPADPGKQPAASDLPHLLTVAEIAVLVRVSRMTIYRMIRRGELPAIVVGRSYRIPAEAARRLMRHPGPPPQ